MNKPDNLVPEMLSLHAINSFAPYNSSPRAVMFASHISQRLVIEGAEEKRIQTGVEKDLANYTFDIRMPENGKIIKVLDRYPKGADSESLSFNPETIVIYEKDESKQLDYFSIPKFGSYHQFFGFKYHLTDNVHKLYIGSYIAKDTVFATSSSVGENNGYKYGINANVAFMTVPSISEDGIMVNRNFLKRLKFNVYETRVLEFGSNNFPLNLYGTKTNYKPFPDIGDYIRDDGILMGLRTYNDHFAPVEMSAYDTMDVDFIFDKLLYARGKGGRVIDIKVVSNNINNKKLPLIFCSQLNKYRKAYYKYYRTLTEMEKQIRADRKKKYGTYNLSLSPKLHRLLVEGLNILNHDNSEYRQNLNLCYRKTPIDEYRIEFVLEYTIEPNIGFKLTDQMGGKGVICKIEEPENMPIDQDGNIADIVMDPLATVKRMNIGRLYEQYINSAIRDAGKNINRMLSINTDQKIQEYTLRNKPIELVNSAYEFLLNFYKHISLIQYNFYKEHINEDGKYEHLTNVVNNGIYIYYPVNNDQLAENIVNNLELDDNYRPTYGPVTYVGNSGNKVVTEANVRIGGLYIMLLEKIADDWSAVATGKLQHFGVLSSMTKAEKFSFPWRNTAVRFSGETESRIFVGYCGRTMMAELMDRSNNPITQRNIVWNILKANNPSNITDIVDRSYIPLGSGKNLQLINHMFSCGGFRLIYKSDNTGSNSSKYY